jgi:ubiquinone/menaquinone biosynthesis C-methylase UbiE
VPHKFEVEFCARLLSPERRRRQPVAPALRLLGLSRRHVVVDLGCGPGYYLIPAARRVALAWGLDLSPTMLRAARKAAAAAGLCNVRVRRSTEQRLPLPAGSAHRALMVNVLHELASPRRTLAEICRVLAPGGRLLLVDWRRARTYHGPPKGERIAVRAARRMLVAAGFVRITAHRIYRRHWALLAEKSGAAAR